MTLVLIQAHFLYFEWNSATSGLWHQIQLVQMASDFLFHPCRLWKLVISTLFWFVFFRQGLLRNFFAVSFLSLKLSFSPCQGFDQYNLTVQFLLLKNYNGENILKKSQKHHSGDSYVTYSTVVPASVNHLAVIVYRTGNFPLDLVLYSCVFFGAEVGLFLCMDFESFNPSCF